MDARAVVRADAAFEAVLGTVLAAGAAAGWLGAGDFPHPVGAAVVVIAGALLLLLGAVLWGGGIELLALAAGNVMTAIAGIVWLALGSGFSTAGSALVAVTVAGLVALAAAQVATLRA
jgi:hypothetical protein